MAFILSKLSNNQNYVKWVKGANGINQACESVLIKGGADVINKRTLETPQGVVTEVTEAQLELLKENPDFRAQVEAGFLSIIENKISEEKAEEKAAEMPKDNSRQKTPKDYKSKGKAKPKKDDNEE